MNLEKIGQVVSVRGRRANRWPGNNRQVIVIDGTFGSVRICVSNAEDVLEVLGISTFMAHNVIKNCKRKQRPVKEWEIAFDANHITVR